MVFLLSLLSTIVLATEPLKVAVIDTGLNLQDERFKPYLCKSGHYDFTETGIQDDHGHGTHVTGLIIKNALPNTNFCLMIYKYYLNTNSGVTNLNNTVKSMVYAALNGAKIINQSGGGPGRNFIEESVISYLNQKNVMLITSAGNEKQNLSLFPYYPASYNYPNIIVVGNGKNNKPNKFSNYGDRVNIWIDGENIKSTLPNGYEGYMSGTSMSAAIYTGKLLRNWK